MSIIWCRHQESNSGPTDYKSVALPTELCRRWKSIRNFVAGERIIRILPCRGKNKRQHLACLWAGRRVSQQDLFLAVTLDNLASAFARRQSDVDVENRSVPDTGCNVGVKPERFGL